jgi:hypothetical protein
LGQTLLNFPYNKQSNNKMKRFYLHATSSTCYDATGITYPNKIKIDLKSFVKAFGAECPYFVRRASNLPAVIEFIATEANAFIINKKVYEYGLIVHNWN